MHLCWFSSYKFTYVEPGFDDEPATSTKEPDQSYEERKDVQGIDQTRRHANWVKVQDPNTKHGSWRPRQKHRSKGKQWCRALDNQFRKSTGKRGLIFFKHDVKLTIWKNPRNWPAIPLFNDCNETVAVSFLLFLYSLYRSSVSGFMIHILAFCRVCCRFPPLQHYKENEHANKNNWTSKLSIGARDVYGFAV